MVHVIIVASSQCDALQLLMHLHIIGAGDPAGDLFEALRRCHLSTDDFDDWLDRRYMSLARLNSEGKLGNVHLDRATA
eukprot:CAMPEP_0170630668 /NCGR_PEP_ID=MMETSP0224-20130122/34147_1 /TAXON_ID=285029 /ORGANISM="Togula jolla, Strain CCCM 725" /LENGTH=77 /DNA_ID=CAMNT_0010958789 /DNA_START=234 /DNA_END=467 /DNA_ORIENTATION=+